MAMAVVKWESFNLALAILCVLSIPFVLMLFPFAAAGKVLQYSILYQFAFNGKVSGRMDGNVLMRNGRGRGMTVPALVQNAYTTLQRSLLAGWSTAFRSLTQAQITAWNNFKYTKSDVFGMPYDVKGKAAYIALNQNLDNIAAANISNAPVSLGATNTTISALDADTTAGTLKYASTAYDPLFTYLVFATAPLSPGINRPSQSAFRLIGTAPALALGIATITALYVSKFGALPPIGSKIFLYTKAIRITTGEASPLSATLTDVAS